MAASLRWPNEGSDLPAPPERARVKTMAQGPAQDTVLVVDDEADLCRLLGLHLRQAGFRVEEARTGSDALALAARARPLIIVLDLMLPDLPGGEICRRLRA